MRTPESYERADIQKFLDSIGAVHFHMVTRGFGASGAPDLTACIRGQFWGIEVKREGKPLTKLQEQKLEAIKKAGGMIAWGTAAVVIPLLEEFNEFKENESPVDYGLQPGERPVRPKHA